MPCECDKMPVCPLHQEVIENQRQHVIRYETPIAELCEHPRPFIFLAGPTVRGNQPHLRPSWRIAAVELFKQRQFPGTLILPEFTDPDESDKGRDELPEWEFNGMRGADCIMFWIPRTRELIGLTTNFELGYWLRFRGKVVYGRPDDAYRIRYLDILWKLDAEDRDWACLQYDTTIHNTLPSTVDAAMKLAGEVL